MGFRGAAFGGGASAGLRLRRAALVLGLLGVVAGGVCGQTSPARAVPAVACAPDLAVLSRADGTPLARFSIEVAQTEADRARGLMERSSMPAGAGMLFIYPTPRTVQFWMHDTLIPLDMLFFDAAGRLVSLHSGARPMDDTAIPSGGAVRFVLEINGNLAKRMGLGTGTVLSHPAIPNAQAALPCAD
ncbi:DUF192 domain-containing protein [Paenirhodobacter enshiensis]|uniref:DUF192 domain-containing protein n=1 Tax=Paenirhodobacter enshiensis TaxID=1105367 RepID=UPI001376C386|nr:DUF192 domain-containing protein [Paenirhodobacter enshiensis]